VRVATAERLLSIRLDEMRLKEKKLMLHAIVGKKRMFIRAE